MPTFRVISELDTGVQHRESRGSRLHLDEVRKHTLVTADSLTEAVGRATTSEPHQERRITHVEEVHPGVRFSDEQITRALTEPNFQSDPVLVPGDFEDRDIDRTFLLHQLVYGLRETGLVPGLDVSVLDNETDEPYAMVEIHDDARGIYLSRGCEVRKLTEDRDATGWDQVLATAQAVIAHTNDLH